MFNRHAADGAVEPAEVAIRATGSCPTQIMTAASCSWYFGVDRSAGSRGQSVRQRRRDLAPEHFRTQMPVVALFERLPLHRSFRGNRHRHALSL